MQKPASFVNLLFMGLMLASCQPRKPENEHTVNNDLQNIVNTDTLRIATMYGSTSYFLFRDEYMGFDYEMAEDLANYLHVNIDVTVARSESELAELLQTNQVDLVAYNLIETKELKKQFNFVLPQSESHQVLVQNMGASSISDVTELAGKSVYVTSNSIFQNRLQSLNDEIGGTIKIITVPDSVSEDDLINEVAEKKIGYTLAYYNVAILHKSFQRTLDCHLSVGFDQRNGWLIRKSSRKLEKIIKKWEDLPDTHLTQERLFDKYWNKSPYVTLQKVKIPKGHISPYDHLFKKYAPEINWDWRLLAALAFHESRFDTSQVSWAGAAGIMQLMPRTASNFGLDRRTVKNPEMNIEAGVEYIKSLNLAFRQIENKEERIKFILAAYNSGPAHILDAMALANKYGKNPHIWFNQVEYFLLKKSEPEFYNDPVVKYGYFRGNETVRYVKNTLNTYEKYIRRK